MIFRAAFYNTSLGRFLYSNAPARQLFHIAMNGMAASDKIFNLLDIKEENSAKEKITDNTDIECNNLSFSYDESREILHGVNMSFKRAVLQLL